MYSRCIGRVEEADEVAQELGAIAHHQVERYQGDEACTHTTRTVHINTMKSAHTQHTLYTST